MHLNGKPNLSCAHVLGLRSVDLETIIPADIPRFRTYTLTFAYGGPLPPTRLLRVIDRAQAELREQIDEGSAQANKR